ncbi:hypothetical protein MIMGU_mgv1a021137mg [Erythranthe guttata]|uniref:Late embryogenesis abundant protein LEA-2 subgroup domain-containing protein n=1 Tax=Erythranthe guttata TaxID=4155 RepID=A0A022RE87_ERYGU|nr:PREDICTED: protein YLS9-like [Erythranthe guttata]EYU38692.1 hypothetical protein MIMGU_mgv1a021137mg [Erythranthe guttata]|eukprot:XP_012835825.1 PREDICTED: protein YLS9-like [Erythranthe guttata]
MASSAAFAAAAAAPAGFHRNNRVADAIPPDDVAPPRDAPPPPPPPAAAGHAIYVQQLYRDPPRQRFQRLELTFLCRTLTWSVLIFIFTASLSILLWLIFHPTFPQLHVTSATMSAVTFTNTTKATAEFSITLQLTNTNRHLTTIYDQFQIFLIYPSQQVLLSQNYQPPFVQPKKTRTTIETNLGFTNLDLGNYVANGLKEDLDRGSLNLGIRILAVVRYKNGKWKTKSQFMRAYCSGVSFGFTSINRPGIFLNPYQECEVYIYTK